MAEGDIFMKNILIVYGDPYQSDSVANKRILEIVKEKMPEIEIDDLDHLYPDFNIDAKAEQAKLAKADTVVFMSPIYWYNASSLMRRWFEVVLAYGWAYGSQFALEGKSGILSLTAGGPEQAYTPGPECVIPEADLLKPLDVIFPYLKMNLTGTVFSTDMPFGNVEEKCQEHAEKLLAMIQNS